MTLPVLSQSPTDPGFVQSPYAFYERARAAGPFFEWADYGLICTASAAAVSAVLKDRRLGREVPAEMQTPVPAHLAPFYAVEAHSMLELEPPRHTRLRSLVLRAFTSRRIAALAPEVAALSHALIDTFPAGDFDLLTGFAQRLPVIIIARMLGVPEARADDLLAWSNAMVGMYQARRTRATEDAAVAATQAFVAFLRGHIEDRRTTPGDDLITHLIAAESEGEKLSTDELITTCILLLNAGHEATVHTLGNGIKRFWNRDTAPRSCPPTASRQRWRRSFATTRRCIFSPAGSMRMSNFPAGPSGAATGSAAFWPPPTATRSFGTIPPASTRAARSGPT